MYRFSENIIFNERDLCTSVPNAHVLDINVGAISIIPTSQDRGMGAGAIFAGARDGSRDVKISVELPLDQSAALMCYNNLRAWAESSQPAPLLLPGTPPGYLMAILTDMSDLSMRDYYEPIDLIFTAYNPYFIEIEQQSAEVGESFFVAGDVSTDFVITATIEEAVTAPTWLIDGVRKIAMTGTVGVGTLVINTETGAVELNGDSIKAQIDLTSRFYPLEPGSHTITGPDATITWSERWR